MLFFNNILVIYFSLLSCRSHHYHMTKTLSSLQYYSTGNIKYLGKDVKELTIPLAHGHVAAKAWGRNTGYPVLALHGWLDNCGTFDKLFPLLSDKLYIVAIDAPGHGMSTHKPPGCFDTDISMIIDVKKITDFLGWQTFSILGHSFGSALGLTFSAIFPESIKKLVAIEMAKPNSKDLHMFPDETREAVRVHLDIERKLTKPAPVYTEESAAKRLCDGLFGEISVEGARILNKRGTKPSECGKGVVFTIDKRCRTIEVFSRKDHGMVRQFMSAVQCELLMIMAKKSNPIYEIFVPGLTESFYEIYRENAKKFILHNVDGNHFVHLNNPERIAPLINDFFSDV